MDVEKYESIFKMVALKHDMLVREIEKEQIR